jgi:DNA excision repair protein ERCC-5
MKAMRDDRGDMIRNAHLLGFFRRICKLLYLRIKPVFVFDGGTPALKRRTVIARRRQREQAQFRFRKTAEKLLLNHLRTRKLEEIAGDIGSLNSRGQNHPLGGHKRKGYADVVPKETEPSTEGPTVAETTAGSEAPSPVVASVSCASTYPQGSADAL